MKKRERQLYNAFYTTMGRFGAVEAEGERIALAKRCGAEPWTAENNVMLKLEIGKRSSCRIVGVHDNETVEMLPAVRPSEFLRVMAFCHTMFSARDLAKILKRAVDVMRAQEELPKAASIAIDDLRSIHKGTMKIAMMPCFVRGVPATAVAELKEGNALRPMFIVFAPSLEMTDLDGNGAQVDPQNLN
jgi:hypothetical protein